MAMAAAPVSYECGMAASSSSYTPKPSFRSLINTQDSEGNWTESSKSLMDQFMNYANEFNQIINENKDIEQIVYTIIAIFIFEEMFNYNKNEWSMVVTKAKRWLRQQNIDQERKTKLD